MKHIHQPYFPELQDAYLVGGCVRDIFLDRSPTDFDLVVLKDPEGAARIISHHNRGKMIRLGKPDFILYRIISDDFVIDVQSVKGGSIEEDLNQRDFTINAMACPTTSGEVIDIHNGQADLLNRIVRMTSEGVFKTDPVRLIRAYRLAAVLGFDIDSLTQMAIKNNSHSIRKSAGERIREELYQLLSVNNAFPYLKEMATSDLLFDIFPELSALRGCAQNRFHIEDVWDHTLSTLRHLEHIFANLKYWLPNLSDPLDDCFGNRSKMLLKLSALLHDIGKPASKSYDDDGNAHFYGHENIGVEIARPVLERLKLSNADKQFIEHMISRHLLPLQLFQAEKRERLTPRGKTRFFMRNGEMTPFILLHALADQMAKEKNKNKRFLRFVRKLMEDFFFSFKKSSRKPGLISGHDLGREFHLPPSPLYRTILTMIEEKRLSGEITTKGEALTTVRRFLRSKDILPDT